MTASSITSWVARCKSRLQRRSSGVPLAPEAAATAPARVRDFLQPARQVLVTGARGAAAQLLLPLIRREPFVLREVDLAARGDEHADLTDAATCDRVVHGIDAIVHLAGHGKEAPVQDLLGPNSLALGRLLQSAAAAGVSRFVFASSMHVMGLYERDAAIDETMPPRPDGHYAAAKLHGEALCRVYAERHGMAVTCLRIGALAARVEDVEPGSWIGPEDLMTMVRIGLAADRPWFEIFHAVAAAEGSPLPPSRAAAFGYRCQHPGEPYADSLARAARWWPRDELARTRRGASFASAPLT
jgi:uronate dehydrogenase